RLTEAESPASLRRRTIGPPITQFAPVHQSPDVVNGIAGVSSNCVLFWVIRPVAGILNVIDIAAQPAEPLKVVQHLPGHARERRPAHHAQEDQLQSLSHWRVSTDATAQVTQRCWPNLTRRSVHTPRRTPLPCGARRTSALRFAGSPSVRVAGHPASRPQDGPGPWRRNQSPRSRRLLAPRRGLGRPPECRKALPRS